MTNPDELCHEAREDCEVSVCFKELLAKRKEGGIENLGDAGDVDLGVFRVWMIAVNKQSRARK